MGRIITLFLAALVTPMIVLLSPEARAQQRTDPGAADLGAYSPQLEARSRRIFPWASQEQKRQQWMADQEQRAIANDINRTKPQFYPASER
jgi:hypothetical protein